MNKIFLSVIVSLFTFLAFKSLSSTFVKSSEPKGFALIELFTSEGCSSCPPAEELINRISKEYKDQQVYILAYHVDYWDRLGWKDPFSNADFSKRQYDYSGWLHTRQVYTPQVVMNGQVEFVGSDERKLRNVLKERLSNEQLSTLVMNAELQGENIKVSLEGQLPDNKYDAVLALVQKKAVIKVERGENAGRILQHIDIVRSLMRVPFNKNSKSELILPFPAGNVPSNFELIGFVQNHNTAEIVSAAKKDLANLYIN